MQLHHSTLPALAALVLLLHATLSQCAAVAASARNAQGTIRIALVSDAQFYYTVCKNEPKEHCIFSDHYIQNVLNKPKLRKPDRQVELHNAAARQLRCLTKAGPFAAVFDGGDLTNQGAATELTALEAYHADLKINTGVAPTFMLGNHDYAYEELNNGRYKDADVLRMLAYFSDNYTSMPNLRSADWTVAAASGGTTRYTGSMAYTVEIGNYVIFMLQWTKLDRRAVFTRSIAGAGREYDITSFVPWFEDELRSANAAGKHIILFPHSAKMFADVLAATRPVKHVVPRTEHLAHVVAGYKPAAVFSGHDHDAWGLQDDQNKFDAAGYKIPLVYAGSLSYQTFVTVDLKSDGTFAATAVNSGTQNCDPIQSSDTSR